MTDNGRFVFLAALTLLITALVAGYPAGSMAGQGDSKSTRALNDEAKQKLTGIYAQHLATSACKNDYSMTFNSSQLSSKDFAQLAKHVDQACGCLYTSSSSKVTPEMAIDYVMYIYGARRDPFAQPSQEVRAYVSSKQFSDVSLAYSDEATRKKCGFVK